MTKAPTDSRLLLLGPQDNVYVLRAPLNAGATIDLAGVPVRVPRDLSIGHKLARCAIATGQQVIKYGAPIGRASRDIVLGEHVHVHNLASDYTPSYALNGEPT